MRSRRLLEPGLADALVDVDLREPCPRCAVARKRVAVNSVEFDVLNRGGFVEKAHDFIRCGGSHVVHFLAVHPTVAARQVPRYRALLNSADLVVPDGAPIAAVMRLRHRGARRTTSTDGFLQLCGEGGVKHFFVGGASDQVKTAMEAELRRKFPAMEIAGHVVPPFRPYREEELAELAKSIDASGADIVWVGIGAPKQEVLAHQLRKLGASSMIACIGATFDFVAGTKTRAPAFMRAIGLEWLYRLAQEPRRLWRRYLIGNARFIGAVAGDEMRRLFRQRAAGGINV